LFITKDPIQKYFKVGIVSFMAYPSLSSGDDPETLKKLSRFACDSYFNAVEVAWIKDREVKRQAAKLLESSRIEVCYGASPRFLKTGKNANALDEAERVKAEETLIEAVDEAKELGAGSVAFLSGKWSKETFDENYSQLLKTTRAACSYAKEKNIFVELEVFDYDIAKASLIGPAPLAARFAADMRMTHPNFGLLVDLSHIPMCRETPAFAISVMRPYITHFHIGNTVCLDKSAEGYGDEHQRFGFPGGSNDVPELLDFLQVLKKEGFFRPDSPYVLSFEVKPWGDEDPEAVIEGSKRALDRAWALLED
jgi:sugar phosphate isomerase/epimerase